MVFAWFLQNSEASMVGFCLIWDLTSKSSFSVLNHFWGIFAGRDIWKPTLNFLSIINFQCVFVYFQQKTENFMKPFQIFRMIYQNGPVLWSVQATCHIPMSKRYIYTVVFVFEVPKERVKKKLVEFSIKAGGWGQQWTNFPWFCFW